VNVIWISYKDKLKVAKLEIPKQYWTEVEPYVDIPYISRIDKDSKVVFVELKDIDKKTIDDLLMLFELVRVNDMKLAKEIFNYIVNSRKRY